VDETGRIVKKVYFDQDLRSSASCPDSPVEVEAIRSDSDDRRTPVSDTDGGPTHARRPTAMRRSEPRTTKPSCGVSAAMTFAEFARVLVAGGRAWPHRGSLIAAQLVSTQSLVRPL
jgi:hypothetical protein